MAPTATAVRVLAIAATGLLLGLSACRGGTSTSPPVHLVLDMDFQPKLTTQSKAEFPGWKDHRSMRVPAKGTIARDSLPNPTLMPNPTAAGKNPDGSWITQNPLPLSMAVMQRGRERFDINCAICHGYSGRGGNGKYGHGMVGRLWPAGAVVANFHAVEGKDNRVANLSDGELFDVISNGKNTMPAYGDRISLEDRWSIIHYVRALQELGRQ